MSSSHNELVIGMYSEFRIDILGDGRCIQIHTESDTVSKKKSKQNWRELLRALSIHLLTIHVAGVCVVSVFRRTLR